MNRKVYILQSVQALRALAVIIVMLLTSVTVWAEEITVNLGEGRGTATFSEASLMFSNCEANGDKKVDVADLVEMVNARDNHPSVRFVLKAADFDGSGSITDSDITTVANLIMNIINIGMSQ